MDLSGRPKWEGGQYEGDDSKRLDALCRAVELGANYVDVEFQVGFLPNIFVEKLSNFHVRVHASFGFVFDTKTKNWLLKCVFDADKLWIISFHTMHDERLPVPF